MKAESKPCMEIWNHDLAVGSREYVTEVKSALDIAAKHSTVAVDGSVYALKEPVSAYTTYFMPEILGLSNDKTVKLE